MEWIELNEDLLHEAFQDTECEALLKLRSHADPVPGICAGLAASIRAAILANGRGGLQGGELSIPQALRAEAVAMLRLQVLLRYDLSVSDARRDAAREAAEKVEAIRRGELPFATEAVATRPTYHAPAPSYRRHAGLLPSSRRYPNAL